MITPTHFLTPLPENLPPLTKDQTELLPEQAAWARAVSEQWTRACLHSGGKCDPTKVKKHVQTILSWSGYTQSLEQIYFCASPGEVRTKYQRLTGEIFPAQSDSYVSMAVEADFGAWTEIYEGLGATFDTALNEKRKILIDAYVNGLWMMWPFQEGTFISAPPTEVQLDENKNLHNINGPAIKFADGFSAFFYKGTELEPNWVLYKDHISPELALTHSNTTVRQALSELLGWARILEALPQTVLDEHPDPQMGTLIETVISVPGTDRKEKQKFLKVQCGTGRMFAILCPEQVQTVQEAQSVNYGFTSPDRYKPYIRT